MVLTSTFNTTYGNYGGGWAINIPALGIEIYRVLKTGGVAVVVINKTN